MDKIDIIKQVKDGIKDTLDYGYFKEITANKLEDHDNRLYFDIEIKTIDDEKEFLLHFRINQEFVEIEANEDCWEAFEKSDQVWKLLFWQSNE